MVFGEMGHVIVIQGIMALGVIKVGQEKLKIVGIRSVCFYAKKSLYIICFDTNILLYSCMVYNGLCSEQYFQNIFYLFTNVIKLLTLLD